MLGKCGISGFKKVPFAAKRVTENIAHSVRAQLSKATDDELRAELMSLNRIPVLRSQPQRVLPALDEVKSRVKYVSPSNFRDAVIIASGSNHHEIALELFALRFESHRSDSQFAMIDAVVDSAYALGRPHSLLQLCEMGAKRLSLVPDDYPTDLCMGRLLWRAACLAASAGVTETHKSHFASMWKAISSYNVSTQFKSLDSAVVFRALVRRVRYSTRDSGEMHSFAYLAGHGVIVCAEHKPLQYFVNALRSCKVGRWDDQAQVYFDEYSSGQEVVDEVVVFSFLSVLQAAKAYPRIASFGRKMFSSGWQPSSSVLTLVAQAASEAAAADVVMAAFGHVLARVGSPEPPTKYAAFACLVAMGKCGGQTAEYLEHVADFASRQLIDFSKESRLFLILQHAVHAVDPWAVAAESIEEFWRDESCQTERIFNQLLQLQLRMDAPDFLVTFKAARQKNFFRPPWIELLVTWADRRRYEISSEDRKFILKTVSENRATPSAAVEELVANDAVAGLRPMLAIMQHDDKNQPRDKFRLSRSIGDPPKLTDSRVYFLKSRRASVLYLRKPPSPGQEGSHPRRTSTVTLREAVLQKALRILQCGQSDELKQLVRLRELPDLVGP